MSGNITFTILIVVLLGIYGATIWFSVKAKPLGPPGSQKPFRWGTYIALTTGLASLIFPASVYTALKNGRFFGAVFGALLTFSCFFCCVSLLRRKRYSVWVFFIAYGLIVISGPLLHTYNGTKATPAQNEQSSMFFVYFLVTGYYMWKRWHLFGLPVDNSATRSQSSIEPDCAAGS
jgi:hypothetical protein